MTRRKRNQWRKWQASAAATLTVAALFQYVRTSDAFDVAYAAANGTDTSVTASNQVDTHDDVMDEWINSTTDSNNWNTQDNDNNDSQYNGTSDSTQAARPDQSTGNKGNYSDSQRIGQNNQDTDSGYSSGNYQSRTGLS
ncbi:hypothetical protein KQ941_24395 [Paenibacillus xylanexedens]|uniref:hypothetical protein n=1 Tax=Paenibacillus xylanexedens TaxID=528191 RepID=UPI001F3B9731|nr:hypothetical protein [Paenibacillus xylanexedens]MCF7757583.1 hypothetical protein [Paenibacillus xylanexedens]